MHFLCAYAGLHIDPQYLYYETDFNTILFGIDDYKDTVHVLNEADESIDVHLYYYRNITVTDDNKINVEKKPKITPFKDYFDYLDRLCNSMKSVVKNAQDGNRKFQYDLVTTISKGYDAPCCAVIAKKCGCDTAVTFNAVGKYTEDSGVEIATKLGSKKLLSVMQMNT